MRTKINSQEKDEADIFREQSLKAIRRRKCLEKATEWTLYILTATVIAFTVFAYFFDE